MEIAAVLGVKRGTAAGGVKHSHASLQLARQLGTEVVPVLSRKEQADPAARVQALTQSLCTTGTLTGAIRIPDTVGHLGVTADLRAGRVTCHVDIDAPREGRATTRVNWLVRQLKHAPDATRVEAFVAHARGSQAAELLATVRENPASSSSTPRRSSVPSASRRPPRWVPSAAAAAAASSTPS
jgi:hypothetical protein